VGVGYVSAQVLRPNVDEEVLGVGTGLGAISEWAAACTHGGARQGGHGQVAMVKPAAPGGSSSRMYYNGRNSPCRLPGKCRTRCNGTDFLTFVVKEVATQAGVFAKACSTSSTVLGYWLLLVARLTHHLLDLMMVDDMSGRSL
jgi:hypothetical protein